MKNTALELEQLYIDKTSVRDLLAADPHSSFCTQKKKFNCSKYDGAGGLVMLTSLYQKSCLYLSVLDERSRILKVVVVRRIFKLGTGNLEWGGSGKG
jgi:hypothetical protein